MLKFSPNLGMWLSLMKDISTSNKSRADDRVAAQITHKIRAGKRGKAKGRKDLGYHLARQRRVLVAIGGRHKLHWSTGDR